MPRPTPSALLALGLLALTSACAARRDTTPAREAVAPANTTRLAPYSPAVRAGGFIFLSGSVGTRPGTRELVPGGAAAETRQALENLLANLRAAGGEARDVVKCTVFLADIRDYEAVNQVYGEFFRAEPPARSAVGVAALPLGARVEVECIAVE